MFGQGDLGPQPDRAGRHQRQEGHEGADGGQKFAHRLGVAGLAHDVDAHGDQDDAAGHDHLPEGVQLGQRQAVVDQLEKDDPHEGPPKRPAPAEQGCAADDHGRDRVQFPHLPIVGLGIGRATQEQKGAEGRREGPEHVGHQRVAAGVDPGLARTRFVRPDGIDVAAITGVGDDHGQHDEEGDEDQHRHLEGAEEVQPVGIDKAAQGLGKSVQLIGAVGVAQPGEGVVAAEIVEGLGQFRGRLGIGRQMPGAAPDRQARKGDDEGRHAEIGDQRAVEGPDRQADAQPGHDREKRRKAPETGDIARQSRGQPHDGSHGQVDPGGQDDQGHPSGDDADRGRVVQDRHQVRRAEEHRVDRRHLDREAQDDDRQQRPGPFGAEEPNNERDEPILQRTGRQGLAMGGVGHDGRSCLGAVWGGLPGPI